MVVVKNEGHSRGLALLWKTKNTVSLLGFSQNFIDVVVRFPDLLVWRMIDFYGCAERHRRKESWDILINLNPKSNFPWCIVGDFNDILTNSKKKGRVRHPPSLIAGFQTMVQQCGIFDIPLIGHPYTWERGRGTPQWVEEKLDRVMVTKRWWDLFHSAKA